MGKSSKEDVKINLSKGKRGIDTKSMLIGALATVVIGLIILLIVVLVNGNNGTTIENTANSMEEALDNSFKETRLGEEYKEAVNNILKSVNHVKDNNGYLHVYTDKDKYDTYIYNKKGEAFGVGSESKNMTVFRNDGTSIMFTDVIVQTEALDILELVINSLNAIDNDKIEMYESVSEVTDHTEYIGYHEYVAVFDSYDDIRKLYTSVSDEYADSMIEDIKGAFHEGVVPTFKIYYMISDGGGLTVACHLLDGDETYLNWYFDGYLTVYDWELPEEWYTYDFSEADKSEEMLTSLADSITEMITQYASDNEITLTDGENKESEPIDTSGETPTTGENTEAVDNEGTVENTEAVDNESDGKVVDTSQADKVEVKTDENGDKVYTYEGELDTSKMPTVSLEEAEDILSKSELEDSNIDKLDDLAKDSNN